MQVAAPIAAGHLRQIEVVDLPEPVRDAALVRRAAAPELGPASRALVEAIRRRAEQLDLLSSGP
jgi:hypothetical protein